MKLKINFLSILIFIASFQVCFGQEMYENQPEENWLKQYSIYNEQCLFFRYDRYSKDDVVKFRQKLDLLKDAKYEEWEGIYFRDLEELGFSQLRWNSESGFLSFYIYTCMPELRHINYGKIVNTSEYIQILPEFAATSPRKAEIIKYVKVKWNDRHYLVEESSLPAFAEKAVGIFVDPEDTSDENYQKWSNYWVNGDLEKDLTGLPEFPNSYKKFQRLPIETAILSVGKRAIEKENQFGSRVYTDEAAIYRVTIGAGKDKGVKTGMTFKLGESNEEIFITQVNEKTSVGVIARFLDDNKNDECLDDEANKIACPKIKPSLKVKTRIGNFWY